ncbi:2Fe-2S iron-sulfur cluster-binding protein [Rhodoferax aquaticus]|uniref:2Fe-2S iron-sulfur cluster binding domain-containing protein n=1 Tax=Rhodoferax aquaticus TaxID=2527691 RepID=A0A515ESG0_9BURK|nr:2Fe-2S iron-sulfur cluster-binding protein [Rhodoferax aquaticus]QDL55594.1 2Fe-2S iron-sulfur cluster binding domain-containing protein [Rhodoferax aquaticus]
MTSHSDRTQYQVCLSTSGTCFPVAPEQTILQAALGSGIELLSSCRNGTCRTCICRMSAGHVHYRMAWPGLSAEEKASGFILPCVAYVSCDITLEHVEFD